MSGLLAYVVKRFATSLITLAAMSVLVFVIVDLPPGDFASARLAELISYGESVSPELADNLRKTYGLDKPLLARYWSWFSGLLRGDAGMSMLTQEPVAEVIAARLPVTLLLSVTVFIFMWCTAIPIGIYSAVRQYSLGDYVATVIGLIGLALPNFLLAILLVWFAYDKFDFVLSGLYSRYMVDAPMSAEKLLDGIKHGWAYVLVVGTAGTAGLMRLMRANLLDEMSKPYVKTARSKGLSERKVIWRYPVRLALIPLASTIGFMLPALLSADVIVSVVLNVPTLGPILLDALLKQDMILAGNILFLFGLFTVIGNILSDVILYCLDPRIQLDPERQS